VGRLGLGQEDRCQGPAAGEHRLRARASANFPPVPVLMLATTRGRRADVLLSLLEEGCLGLSDVDDPLVPRLLTPPPPGPCFGPHRTRPTTRLQGKGGTCAADRGAGRPWQTSCATVDAAGVGPARGHLESTRHGGRHYISHLIARPACPIPRRSCRRGTRRRLWFRVDARPQMQLRRRTCGPIHPGTEPKPEGLRCG
jgi:hypothetical protein